MSLRGPLTRRMAADVLPDLVYQEYDMVVSALAVYVGLDPFRKILNADLIGFHGLFTGQGVYGEGLGHRDQPAGHRFYHQCEGQRFLQDPRPL